MKSWMVASAVVLGAVSTDAYGGVDCPSVRATKVRIQAGLESDLAALAKCQGRVGACSPAMVKGLQVAVSSAQAEIQSLAKELAGCSNKPPPGPPLLVENAFVSGITMTSATVNFQTLRGPTQARISYGGTSGAKANGAQTAFDAATISHATQLAGLMPATIYQYKIIIGTEVAYSGSFQTLAPPPVVTVTPPYTSPLFRSKLNQHNQPLRGFVDLHTHLMNHLGFGGHLVYGAPDVGIVMRAGSIPTGGGGCNAADRPAANETEAIGNCQAAHSGIGLSCYDSNRYVFLDNFASGNGARNSITVPNPTGFPSFVQWPRNDDILHQQMWVEWLKRAKDGGLRVLVADAGNNTTTARAVRGATPYDDMTSADQQIAQMWQFAKQNSAWVQVARSASELRDIVEHDKLAMVIGVELDDIGDFVWNANPPSEANIRAEIKRLHDEGVSHIFPVHIVDNDFGGTAAYQSEFWVANKNQFGSYWQLVCSQPQDNINFIPDTGAGPWFENLIASGSLGTQPVPTTCGDGIGVVNGRGLTDAGKKAIRVMMELGMLIDIDHMSQQTATDTLSFTRQTAGGAYPILSSHNGLRDFTKGLDDKGKPVIRNENQRTADQYREIARRGAMAGVGWAGLNPAWWIASVRSVTAVAGVPIAIGSDLNGFVKQPYPAAPGSSCTSPSKPCVTYSTSFPQLTTGTRTWDFNSDGVAHVGLYPDFLRAVENQGGSDVVDQLFDGAEAFAQMWTKAEATRDAILAAKPTDCHTGATLSWNSATFNGCGVTGLTGKCTTNTCWRLIANCDKGTATAVTGLSITGSCNGASMAKGPTHVDYDGGQATLYFDKPQDACYSAGCLSALAISFGVSCCQ